jgi:hypothetical protein
LTRADLKIKHPRLSFRRNEVDEIQYLKIDLSMPDSFGKALWLPSLHDATPFKTKAEAKSVKSMMQNSSGVFEAGNGLFYVMRA